MNIQPFRVVSTALNNCLHATKLHEQTPKQPVSHNFFQKKLLFYKPIFINFVQLIRL